MFADLWAFVEVAGEKNASDETVKDTGQEQWNQIEHDNVREKVALK